jgi:hypothetical protein
MTREIISLALEAEGFKGPSQSYAIPEEREATFLISAPGDVFSVARITKADLREKFVFLQTAKNEHFYFAYEDVLGLRLVAAATARDRAAGFSR